MKIRDSGSARSKIRVSGLEIVRVGRLHRADRSHADGQARTSASPDFANSPTTLLTLEITKALTPDEAQHLVNSPTTISTKTEPDPKPPIKRVAELSLGRLDQQNG